MDPEFEVVYRELFMPLRVSRKQFAGMINSMIGIKNFGCKENYAIEKTSKVEHLALVLDGR